MASEGNGKGLQIFLSILSIAGLGVAAYTPLYNQIVNVERRLAAHMAERGHPWLLEKNAGARVRFQEVETRLREAKTIADLKFRELKTISVKKTREDARAFAQILRRLREVETAPHHEPPVALHQPLGGLARALRTPSGISFMSEGFHAGASP